MAEGLGMAAELVHLLWEKLLKALKEAESELSGFTVNSYFKEIKKDMDMKTLKDICSVDVPNTLKWLYEVNDILSECRIFVHNKSKRHHNKNLLPCIDYIKEIIFFRKMGKRLKSLKNDKAGLYKLLEDDRKKHKVGSRNLEMVRHTSSEVNVPEIIGFDDQACKLESMLLKEGIHSVGFTAIGIVGMSGVGKTTLVKKVFNSPNVKEKFPKRVWICFSDVHKKGKDLEFNIVISILKKFDIGINLVELNYHIDIMTVLLQFLNSLLSKERYLIVLDDVCYSHKFFEKLDLRSLEDCFWRGLPEGGAVLVTTRLKEVAQYMVVGNNIVNVEPLSEEACWSIFVSNIKELYKQSDHGENDNYWPILYPKLETLWHKIKGDYCCGLPVAAKVLAELIHQRI